MSEYTPTTEEVRNRYISEVFPEDDAEFDRWLRQVKAEAWGEGHWEGWQNATESLTTDMFGGPTVNPYREGRE